jgi:hypothetical protein
MPPIVTATADDDIEDGDAAVPCSRTTAAAVDAVADVVPVPAVDTDATAPRRPRQRQRRKRGTNGGGGGAGMCGVARGSPYCNTGSFRHVIVLDGANVALRLGGGAAFISAGLQLAIVHFQRRGHSVFVCLPERCLKQAPVGCSVRRGLGS